MDPVTFIIFIFAPYFALTYRIIIMKLHGRTHQRGYKLQFLLVSVISRFVVIFIVVHTLGNIKKITRVRHEVNHCLLMTFIENMIKTL